MSWRVDLRGRLGQFDFNVAFESPVNNVFVVGPNGSGKTTLLRAIAGASLPLAGTVEVAGRALMGAGLCLPPEARGIGYLPQRLTLFPHLTVAQNVAFGPRAQGATWTTALARANEVLQQLGAQALASARPQILSGGESQRVALARALAANAKVLLLDEPMAALDLGARRSARQILGQHLSAANLCTLMVTHDPRDVWAFAGGKSWVVAIEKGHVVQQGTAAALAANPATAFLQELFSVA